jgi:hypothetical protein
VHRIPIQDDNNPCDSVWVDPTQKYLIMGEGFMGFTLYDISNILNPVKLSYLDVFNDADDFIVTQDLELLIVGNGVLGITMVDI